MHSVRRQFLRTVALGGGLGLGLGVAGCGFRLRGQNTHQFAFTNLYSSFPPNSALGKEFHRAMANNKVLVLTDPVSMPSSQVVLQILVDQREKIIVGTSIAGQVRDFQLRLRLRFSVFTPTGKILIDETELLLQREFSFTENLALAKETEEIAIYAVMQSEIVQQLLFRLAAIKTLDPVPR